MTECLGVVVDLAKANDWWVMIDERTWEGKGGRG